MSKSAIPNWIVIVSGLIAALGLFVGVSLYVAPGSSMPEIDFTLNRADFLAQMWGARQISIAAIIAYSAWKRDVAMLRVALGAYFLMTFQDIFIGIAQKDTALIAGTSFFCALSAGMLFKLRALRS